jgi:hypothetical protein
MKFPPADSTVLKLPRRHEAASNEPWPESPAPRDNGLAAEIERLRLCEANLRAYEARLRAWQERLVDGVSPPHAPVPAKAEGSRAPFADDAALQAAWAKFYRAHELLEAEQNHLRDERMAMNGRETELKRREKAVEQREAQLLARERVAAEAPVAAVAAAPAAGKRSSRLDQLTHAPFAMAKAVFSPGK